MLSGATDAINNQPARAARLVEEVVGNAWATDAAGRFLYATPGVLGLPVTGLEAQDTDSDEPASGWTSLLHPEDYEAAAMSWRQCLETGHAYDVTHRLRAADGTYRWRRCSGRPVRDAEARIVGWYGSFLEREALHDREQELAQLVDMAPSHVWRLTRDGEPAFFNKRMADYLGPDITSKSFGGLEALLAAVHPDDAPAFRTTLRHSLATGEPFACRYRLRRVDGAYRWMSSRAEPLRDHAGQILQWYGVCHDIDDQVLAEEALRRREQELERLVDAVPAMIWCLSPDGQPSYYSEQLVRWLGVSVEDLDDPGTTRLARAAALLVHPDDSQDVHAELARCVRTGDPFMCKCRVRRHDGAFRWMEGRAQALRDETGNIMQWYGVLIDIEELMRAQDELRGRERELSQLVDMVPSQIWRLSTKGEPIFFNKRMVDFLELQVADTDRSGPGRLEAVARAIHPDDAARFEAALHHSLAAGEAFAMQYRLRRADGDYRWMSGRAEPLRDEYGRIVQWFGLSHDIDDQMRLYADIAEREARIRRLVDSDIIGIVIWDLDGRLIDANDAFLRMVQYDREDVMAGIRWFDITPPEWQEVHAREEAKELAATGKMQAREKEYFRKDGSRVPVLIGAACFDGQSRQGVAYILDLTERKRAEAAVRERERELSQLVDMVPSYLWRITADGMPVFFNKRLVDFLGLDVWGADRPGKSRLAALTEAIIHPDDSPGVVEAFERSLASGERLSMKWRMRRADGVYRWMAASA
ncbi:MAG TPA: PAS domain-containing protein, partial [Geminicoccus sp.]|uniref:PAS domain-containing protein n=1 Tax=Geminicoccus sp. TaxID=2024832 RepID=UPI002B5B4FF3